MISFEDERMYQQNLEDTERSIWEMERIRKHEEEEFGRTLDLVHDWIAGVPGAWEELLK